jgi:hypothetical protein
MQRFAANALPLNVQQFSRFRSKADIWPDFMSTRPSCSASQTLDVVIPGPRALGSALRAVRAQAPRAEPGIHNHKSMQL